MKKILVLSVMMSAFGFSAMAADEIGIPACDAYLKNYDACISAKMPKEAQEQSKASMKQMHDAWKGMAGNANTKPALQQACEQATAAAKQSMGAMGCTF